MNSSNTWNCCSPLTGSDIKLQDQCWFAEETSSAMILWEDLLRAEKAKLAVMPELQEMEKVFWAELDEIEDICWSWSTTAELSLWEECPVQTEPAATLLAKGQVVNKLTEQQKRKILDRQFNQNAAVLPECCLSPQISSPGRETPSAALESADDPLLNMFSWWSEESLGDSNEPLETRFSQNAAVLPECRPGPRISSPGRETLVSVASDAPGLLIHGHSVAEYQQVYHSVVDVMVKDTEHRSRSKKIKRRLRDELRGPRVRSAALRDTQRQITESCTASVYTVHKELNSLKLKFTKFSIENYNE